MLKGPTTVGNRRDGEHPGDIYVGRPTRWGNPFRIGVDGDRQEVVAMYRRWLWEQLAANQMTLNDLAALAGHRLTCWCHPLDCHAHVLARAADWARAQSRRITC